MWLIICQSQVQLMIISAKTNYMKSLLTDSPTTGINSNSIFRNIYGIKQNRMFTIGGPLITFHSVYEMEITLIPRKQDHDEILTDDDIITRVPEYQDDNIGKLSRK